LTAVLFSDDTSRKSRPAGCRGRSCSSTPRFSNTTRSAADRRSTPGANAIGHFDSWIAGDEDGTPYAEQHAINDLAAQMIPTFIVGEPEWHDCVIDVKVLPLSFADMVGVGL
jgi:hypothetical protein